MLSLLIEPPPPSAPVMHSPPKKLTPEEQKQWEIPTSFSNWKNPKGVIVPLEIREQADGRHLIEESIHDVHAKLADSLYVSERILREENERLAAARNREQEAIQAEREAELRKLAAESRTKKPYGSSMDTTPDLNDSYKDPALVESNGKRLAKDEEETLSAEDQRAEREERDRMRAALRRQHEREHRRAVQRGEDTDRLVLDQTGAVVAGGLGSDEEEGADAEGTSAFGSQRRRGGTAAGDMVSAGSSNALSIFDPQLLNRTAGLDASFGPDDEDRVFDAPLLNPHANPLERLHMTSFTNTSLAASVVGPDGDKDGNMAWALRGKAVEFTKD